MHIGIDGLPLTEPRTGVGHYTIELARHLARLAPTDDYELISHVAYENSVRAEASNLPHPPNLTLQHVKVNRLTRRWWSVGLPYYLRKRKLQLFHGTNYNLPFVGFCPTVVTFHDLSLLLHPGTHERAAVTRGRRLFPFIARRARMIITPTESVRSEVCEHLRVDKRRVVAIPEAARECFHPMAEREASEVRRRLGVRDDFLLSVGTLEPRKNLRRLIAAFEEVLRATDLRPQLVLVGRKGWLVDEWLRELEASPVSAYVRWTGYIPDEDLRALYSSCRAFIYPSLYEGFGLPPLEAMSCGAPVIASSIASITEVIGTRAARLVAPTDVRALTENIIELLGNESERCQRAADGIEQARGFTWKRTAQLTREVYRRVVGENERK